MNRVVRRQQDVNVFDVNGALFTPFEEFGRHIEPECDQNKLSTTVPGS